MSGDLDVTPVGIFISYASMPSSHVAFSRGGDPSRAADCGGKHYAAEYRAVLRSGP